jgi:hypothetical protein
MARAYKFPKGAASEANSESEARGESQIQTTLGELVEAEAALRRILAQPGASQRTVYHAAKLARLVAAETKHFHQQRQALFVEHGVERESRTPAERQLGPTVREVMADKLPAFRAAMDELLAVPVTIPWGPLRSCDLPAATAADLVDLGSLCELVEPEG